MNGHPLATIALLSLLAPVGMVQADDTASQVTANGPAVAAWRIEGRVMERGTRSPLQARITPVGPDMRPTSTIKTDEDGRFEVLIPGTGAYHLSVSAPGYAPVRIDIDSEPRGTVVIRLQVLEAEAIVITDDGLEREHVSATSLPRQMVEQTPGTYTDALRLVQSLPGVVQTQEYSPKAGFVAVRGTGPGDNRFFLDGIDIPYLFHFQQYSSVVPTTLLEELTLYPSTFRTIYGNALGAVIDARTRDYAPETVHANVNVNLIMGGASVEVPIGERGGLSVGGRRSYFDSAAEGSSEYTVWPTFWDYHARYDFRRLDGRRVGAFAYGAADGYSRFDVGRAEAEPLVEPDLPEIVFSQGFHASGIRDTSAYNQTYRSESLIAFVRSWEEASAGPDARDGIDHTYLYLRHDGQMQPTEALGVLTGTEFKISRYEIQGDPRGGAFAWPEPTFPTPVQDQPIEEIRRIVGGVYGELDFSTPSGLVLKPGVRVDGDSLTGQFTADPRLTGIYALNGSIGLRGALGVYHQAPDAVLHKRAIEQGQPAGPARAFQGAFGFEATISGRLRGQVQGYVKRLDGLLEGGPPGETKEVVVGDISGSAYGGEVLLRYHLQDRAFAWLSYAYARGLRTDPETGLQYPYAFDQPHAVNAVLSFTPSLRWSYGIRYRLSSGMPFTPVEGAIFDAQSQVYMPLAGAQNSARLPVYQKVDVMFERRISFQQFTLAAYAEAWFVVPSGNVLYPLYSYDYSQVQYVGGPVFVPLVGLRGRI